MKEDTQVVFRLDDAKLDRLCRLAEEGCRRNIRSFGDRDALVEGGGYEKIWLETQPMGGEMYAKRNLTIGLNNQLLFMEHQRADGRLPGSIAMIDGKATPQFNKLQGFCFPDPALNLYYLCGRDEAYLRRLYDCLERFDAYLWRTRNTLGTGCLESFCVCDTGEDHALRYGDAPFWWEDEQAPTGFAAVPMPSMDVTSYSYSARKALTEISRILRNGMEDKWSALANDVKERIRRVFWDDERGACFDLAPDGKRSSTLTHNTLRCMYWGSLSQYMADRFVQEHLLNESEFWTSMPLTSVAANDPLFRNVPTNDWSGQPEGLTYQRAIRALENYGYQRLMTRLGLKLFAALKLGGGAFTQQFDPFTMRPSMSEGQDGLGGASYGPTMLSLLEYVSRLYGVHIERDEVWFGLLGGMPCEYEQRWNEHAYRIENDGCDARVLVDGTPRYSAPCGLRVVTDLSGRLLRTVEIDPDFTAGSANVRPLAEQ